MKQIFTLFFSIVFGNVDFCSSFPLVKVGFLHLIALRSASDL